VTKSVFDLFTGDDLKLVQEAFKKTFATGEGTLEAVLTTKYGRRIPYFFTGVSAKIAGTLYLVGVGLDMSERKQAEDNLRESESLYRIFAERMTEGIMLLNNYKILFVNEAFVTMLGYTDPGQLIQGDVTSLLAESLEIDFREMYEAIEKETLPGIVCNKRRTKYMDGRPSQSYPMERVAFSFAVCARYHRVQT
jgi:PAS domain S-box-containing protein